MLAYINKISSPSDYDIFPLHEIVSQLCNITIDINRILRYKLNYKLTKTVRLSI